jgi:hypothetical protein
MTTTFMRRAFAAAAIAFVATACDSVPGALDPEPEGPARLVVHNASSSRTITSVYVKACNNNPAGDTRWVPVEVAPNQNWSRGWATGCHTVEVDFNSGGGWATNVTLSATTSTTINPF